MEVKVHAHGTLNPCQDAAVHPHASSSVLAAVMGIHGACSTIGMGMWEATSVPLTCRVAVPPPIQVFETFEEWVAVCSRIVCAFQVRESWVAFIQVAKDDSGTMGNVLCDNRTDILGVST